MIPLIVLTVLFVMGLGLLRDFPISRHARRGTVHAQMAKSMKPEIRIILQGRHAGRRHHSEAFA